MSKIEVYGSDYCPYCNKVVNYLEVKKIPFKYIDT
jgi:glutaredoxin